MDRWLEDMQRAMASFAEAAQAAARAMEQAMGAFARAMQRVLEEAVGMFTKIKAAKGLERSRVMLEKLGIGVLKTSRSASKTGWTLHIIVTPVPLKLRGPTGGMPTPSLLASDLVQFWTRVVLADQFPHFEDFEVAVQ